jgi:hypothetical protein
MPPSFVSHHNHYIIYNIKSFSVSSHLSQQLVGAAAVRPNHEVEGDPKFVLSPEPMSLEISTPKFAQVITLLASKRVQKMVVITQPSFPTNV